MGVDMATGTGWPFGGPEVTAAQGSSSLLLEGGRLTGKPTDMRVKRAAPGGEGRVLDPYSSDAVAAYLQRFTNAFAKLPRGAVRAQFHDSFEYYDASWSPLLPAKFQQLNGYDIQAYAAELAGAKPLDADTLGRIKGDYRRTLAALHLEYVDAWAAWSRSQGSRARNQAHGAPGNLLDLYAAADIPETESFGMTPLPIAGMRPDAAGASIDPDPPLNLIGRFASSAAHVAGRALAASETLTWLRENFRETPAAAKPQIDRLFAAGINHIFYHGVSYSPDDAPWPGWFFYAATQLSPDNPLWDGYSALNSYVGRVQAILQSGAPDNDLLLYWPYDDLADDPAGLMRPLGMHDNAWLTDSSTGRLALKLLARGYSFDLISDAQLQRLRIEQGALVAPGGRYAALLVPAARRIPLATVARMKELKRAGAPVLFEALPQDVPGFGNLEERRAQLRALLADATLRDSAADFDTQLQRLSLTQEPAAAAGLAFVRRARPGGHDYFFANLGGQAFDGWLTLGRNAAAALLLDPLSGNSGIAATRGERGGLRAYLQLSSGESAILRTFAAKPRLTGVPDWRYVRPVAKAIGLEGEWQLTFVKGGPVLPRPARLQKLASWTESGDAEAGRFAGTARYRIEFDAPAGHDGEWLLDLGDVREVARVSLNGKPLGAAWSLPLRLRIGRLGAHNTLEIEVSNLPANRIRDLDIRKVDWKIMHDINLASLKYGKFDASGWPVAPAGLLGPVTLVPLELVRPR
jgi:hypothetical protein